VRIGGAGVTDRSIIITSKGKLALALARLGRAWDEVPPPTQARLIAAIAAVADDYAPSTRQPARVPLVGRLSA
jgi:hypothetical protein